MVIETKEVRQGYKMTDFGKIPIEWTINKFTEVCTILNGQVSPLDEEYKNLPHIGNANIEKFTGKLLKYHTAQEDNQISGKFLFGNEHVLYGKINPHFSKVTFPKFQGLCSADIYPIECKKGLLPTYLKYLLLEPRFTKYAISCSARTGIPKINREELELFKFILPSLKDQQKIAEILTTVDDQIENTDLLIEKKKELKKGLMQKLLTKGIGHTKFKQTELGEIPVEWTINKFTEVCIILKGQVSPLDEEYKNLPHIGNANIEKFTGKLLKYHTAQEDNQISGKFLFGKEHVLYGKINPHFSKVAFPKFEGLCSADIYPIECNKKLIPTYLKYLLLESRFTKYAISCSARTGIPKINREELELFKFLLPPIAEQQKIADILSTVDEQIESYEQEKEKYTELKKGLMQQLLTGKIRVTV